MWLRQRNLSPNLELPLTYFHRSLYTRYMRELRKCSYVVTATFHDHDKVQKTDLKPRQLVKSEWSPPLQQLPVSSVSTKFLRIDSTKYSCVQFDVQFSTSVVNKLHWTLAWICVDFSWKTAFISYHVMSTKTRVLKCCCLLFVWTEFWESSALLNRESWLAYGDFREKTWLDHGTKTTWDVSRVLLTSQVGYHAGKPIESVVYCFYKITFNRMESFR